ncbi:GntR family transcriptional regulator [Hoyosella sp. YIM 151337]|uniref:GntR family transcriptional regulator n=1 Tax=Hoyosella sp. YIM 151337 TaxID=2992742 RepID=UPI00223565FB|nr:GntR family transcriptional regulator [Hoyosella sp. YIM 151337]MCW4352744.1 GntR family transcriptional regulator [Hoyosella sp. YIM 151337]
MSKKYSSADRVYERVKEQILTGALAGGELLSEGEIAAELGVSRTPVREGFLRLEAEGWMRLYPKRGALVVPIAEGAAEELVEARYLTEVHAMRMLARDSSARTRVAAALRESLKRLKEHRACGDVGAFAAEDADFHATIVEACHNRLLIDFYKRLRDRQRRMSAQSVARDTTVTPQILDDHEALIEIVERGDADAYADGIWAHMRRAHHLADRPRPDVMWLDG